MFFHAKQNPEKESIILESLIAQVRSGPQWDELSELLPSSGGDSAWPPPGPVCGK